MDNARSGVDGQADSRVVPLKRPHDKAEHSVLRLESIRREVQRVLDDVEPPSEETPRQAVLDDHDLSDANVITNERAFRHRFGPGFIWTRAHRGALIQLKTDNDLTDFEIRLLHWSGSLRRTLSGVELAAHLLVALFGAFLCGLVALVSVAVLWVNWSSTDGSLLGFFRVVLRFGFVSMLGMTVYAFYVHPWRIQRRVELRQTVA